MRKVTSCGGIVIIDRKVLLLELYDNSGTHWVLPKGNIVGDESYDQTALRKVKEETGIDAEIICYLDQTEYQMSLYGNYYDKTVHWYIMRPISFELVPKHEEGFITALLIEFNIAYNLLTYDLEREMLSAAINKLY